MPYDIWHYCSAGCVVVQAVPLHAACHVMPLCLLFTARVPFLGWLIGLKKGSGDRARARGKTAGLNSQNLSQLPAVGDTAVLPLHIPG